MKWQWGLRHDLTASQPSIASCKTLHSVTSYPADKNRKAFSRRRFYGRQMFTESCQPSLRLLIRWPSVSFTNPPSLSLKELSNLLFTPIPRSPLLAKKHHDRHKDGGTSARQGDNHLTLSFPGRQISLQSTWQSDAPFRDKTCSPASFVPSFMSSSRNLQFCLFPNVQRSLQPWLRLWEYFKKNTKTPTNSRSVSKKNQERYKSINKVKSIRVWSYIDSPSSTRTTGATIKERRLCVGRSEKKNQINEVGSGIDSLYHWKEKSRQNENAQIKDSLHGCRSSNTDQQSFKITATTEWCIRGGTSAW